MKITVVILNWNGYRDTLHCLRSLQQCTSPPFDTVVVDNGSTDRSVEHLKAEFPQIPILTAEYNLGYAGGNNLGIQHALSQGAEGIFILNNDTEVTPHCIEAFHNSALHSPHVGIWGGYPLRFHARELLDHLGGVWDHTRGDFTLIGYKEPKGFRAPKPLDYICGCSMFVRREVFETVGLLEPQFFLFWEEADFIFRAKRHGFTSDICYKGELFHKVSASFHDDSPTKKYFWWRSRLLWIERNCSPKEQHELLTHIIQPKLRHYRKLYWIKRLLPSLSARRRHQIEEYRAILQAARDYQQRRFGPYTPSVRSWG